MSEPANKIQMLLDAASAPSAAAPIAPAEAEPKPQPKRKKEDEKDPPFRDPRPKRQKVNPVLMSPKTPRYCSELINEEGQYHAEGLAKLNTLSHWDAANGRFTKLGQARLNKLMNDACVEGNTAAMLDLATCYRFGFGFCDYKKIQELKEKNESYEIESAFDLLIKIVKSPNIFDVNKTVANWVLGEYFGLNLCKASQSLSEKERQRMNFIHTKIAAENGLLVAQNCLGLCYELKDAVPEAELTEAKVKTEAEIASYCQQKAYACYKAAAERGLSLAEYNLALCFQRPEFFVPKELDTPEIRKEQMKLWLKKAANQNHIEAQRLYAECFPEELKKDKPKTEAKPKQRRKLEESLPFRRRKKRKKKPTEIEIQPVTPFKSVIESLGLKPAEDKTKTEVEVEAQAKAKPLSQKASTETKAKAEDDFASRLANILKVFDVEKSLQKEMTEKLDKIVLQQEGELSELTIFIKQLETENAEDEKEIQALESRLAQLNPSMSLTKP